MPKTEWKYRMYLFVRAIDATAANKEALAGILVNNGSGESLENERKMLNNVMKFSINGEEPPQVYGICTAVKMEMRDAFASFIQGLINARYVVVANTKRLVGYQDEELILTNFDIEPNGQIVTKEAVLHYLENEYGLNEIIKEEI